MKIDEILKLVNAGYSKDEIASLETKEPTPEPSLEPSPEPKPEPKLEPNPEPKPEPKPEPANELAEITKRLDELTKAIQTGNTVAATAPTPKENDVNDVILNLIKEV